MHKHQRWWSSGSYTQIVEGFFFFLHRLRQIWIVCRLPPQFWAVNFLLNLIPRPKNRNDSSQFRIGSFKTFSASWNRTRLNAGSTLPQQRERNPISFGRKFKDRAQVVRRRDGIVRGTGCWLAETSHLKFSGFSASGLHRQQLRDEPSSPSSTQRK